MRLSGSALSLAAALVLAGAAIAQQGVPPFDPGQVEFKAERAAGGALIEAGERYLIAGIEGPESKTCRFITEAIEHFTRAAIAIDALAPGVEPRMLTSDQARTLNQKTGAVFERNEKLRQKACKTA